MRRDVMPRTDRSPSPKFLVYWTRDDINATLSTTLGGSGGTLAKVVTDSIAVPTSLIGMRTRHLALEAARDVRDEDGQ